MKTPAFWQQKNIWSVLLSPIAFLYRLGAALDRRFTRTQQASIPVISIGNITAGGAGKTPATMALVQLLRNMGHLPHILTRGYGAQKRSTAHRVVPADEWRDVGDEALLLAQTAPTWVGRDRLASANVAAEAGATLALCDDAHQHYRLRKTIALLVIDGPYGIGNGQLIPAGPMREPFETALARADAVVIIGDDVHGLEQRITLPIFHARLAPAGNLDLLQQKKWLAFAGIGRPAKFFDMLRTLGVTLIGTRAFADHHAYTTAEITALTREAEALGAHLITTEKDAVKLAHAPTESVTTLPITLVFHAPDEVTNFLRAKLA